jgi:hypothetical protein
VQVNPALERAEQEQAMEQEINKLGDLIPFLDSLQELWAEEARFQPVLKLLAAFYRENADAIIHVSRTGELRQAFELAEKAALARAFNLIYCLPEFIKAAKKALEEAEARKKSFAEAQESSTAAPAGGNRLDRTEKDLKQEHVIHKSYADTLTGQLAGKEGGN